MTTINSRKRPYLPASERARLSASGSEKRKRTEQVLVRLTPEERADLAQLAAAHHVTPAEALRLAFTAAWISHAMTQIEVRSA